MRKSSIESSPGTTDLLVGGLHELADNYYDCSNYRQADKFVTTTKAIKEHVRRMYRDGDVQATLDNLALYTIPIPADPADAFTQLVDATTGVVTTPREQVSYLDQEVFRQKINVYVKCEATHQSNMQKLYSLILGQCTELMKTSCDLRLNGRRLRRTKMLLRSWRRYAQ